MLTFAKKIEAAIPALRRYARALTRSSDISDDLVQDTLVCALRSEHLFHDDEVRRRLYTILNNLHHNWLHSLARRSARSSVEASDTLDLEGSETCCRDIEHALATLMNDERSTLLLVALEGFTYHEVAELQGVPIGTVMSHLVRARVQIKSYLDGERAAVAASSSNRPSAVRAANCVRPEIAARLR